jgi:hypothetical protein
MFNSSVLDVAIGLIFVYLLLGLVCTTVNEWIAQKLKMRASTLKDGIRGLLQAPQDSALLLNAFYNHPLIKALAKPGSHPSYVPPKTFAVALIDILSKGQADVGPPEDRLACIKEYITNELPECETKRSLLAIVATSNNSLKTFQDHLEEWFDSSMDSVSGWYKSKVQIWTAIIAVCVTIFVNADTIDIARKLLIYPVLRGQIVQDATNSRQAGQAPPALTGSQKAELSALTGWSADFQTFHRVEACHDPKLRGNLQEVACRSQSDTEAAKIPGLANAWNDDSFPGTDLLTEMPSGMFFVWIWRTVPGHLAGWLVTAIAASLGAPFWFDILNRFMNVRAAGTAPNEKNKDMSKA